MTALNPLFTFLYFLILSCVSLEERHVVKPSLRIDLFLAHPRLLRPLLRLGLHRRGPLQYLLRKKNPLAAFNSNNHVS